MKKAIVLLNGKAGNNYGKRNAFRILEEIYAEGYEALVIPSGPDSGIDTEEIIREHREWFDCCIVVGGDGTLHHAVNSLLRNNCTQPVLYLPCGTTNDFAKSLGIPTDSFARADRMTLDAGVFNEEYFTYVAAFGALTDVSYSTNQDIKNVLGYTAYALSSLQAIPSGLETRIHAQIESKEYSGSGEFLYASISNCYSVAGVRTPILKDAKLDDGKLEVVLIKAPENITEIIDIAGTLVSGDIQSENNRHVVLFQTSKVTFTFDEPVEWTLDGDFGGCVNKAVIGVKRKRIQLLV